MLNKAIEDLQKLHQLLLEINLTEYDVGKQDSHLLNEAREITSYWAKKGCCWAIPRLLAQ